MALMGPSECKSLKIVALSQNRLNTFKNNEICHMFQRIGSRVLGVTPGGLPPETKL